MKTLSYILLSLFIIAACGSGNKTDDPESIKSISKGISSTCLEKVAEKPCSLLNASDVSEFSGISAAEMEMEEPHEVVKNPAYMMCSFNWPSDRTQTIEMMGVSATSPVDNSISFGSILVLDDKVLNRYGGKTRVEYFEDFYGTSTEEEKDAAKEMVDEKLDENEDLSNSEKDMASSIMDMASNFKFTPVSGIGEMASWEVNKITSGGTLIILYGDVIFKVTVNISDENEPNLTMAKKVAQKILDKC